MEVLHGMQNLHQLLVDLDMAMLRALAQNRGITVTTNRQTEAVDRLAVALLDPLSLRTALAHLSPKGRGALDALLAAGGSMRTTQFERSFGQVRPIGPARLQRDAPWKDPANPAEELWYAALAFRVFAADEAGPGEFVQIPEDLLPLLPPPPNDQLPFKVVSLPNIPPIDANGQDLIHDMFAYLVYLQTHDVRSYADGRLGRRDLARLRKRLRDSDGQRLAFLRHLARRLDFVVQRDGFLRLQAAAARRWLKATPGQQLSMLQGAWRDDPTWRDLCYVPTLICDQDTEWYQRYDPVSTRQNFLSLLARCPLDTWWSVSSFVEAVRESAPDFQRPDCDYTSWYIRDAATGEYLAGFESWEHVEGALIVDLLTRPLRWLGSVSIAEATVEQEPASLLACCLTAEGASFLGLLSSEPDSSLPELPLVVHPDFRIEVAAPADLYTRFQLERFADLESAQPCYYRLTVGSLGRCLARGIHVEQLLAFLQRASRYPVPGNVTRQLQEWAGRFDQVRLEETVLLTAKSEGALREISALPQTRSLIGQILSPTTALVSREHLPRLHRELRALGYLPPSPSDSRDDTAERG
jgi:hypothetical protein